MYWTKQIRFEGNGILMVSNPRMANPLDPYKLAAKEITSKRVKTEEDYKRLYRILWEGGLYHDDAVDPNVAISTNGMGPYLVGSQPWKSMWEASKLTKCGKKFLRSTQVFEDKIKIEYSGPREIQAMWDVKDGRFLDVRDGVLTGKRVMAVRPVFPSWAIEITLAFDPEHLDETQIDHFAEIGGRLFGVGTYRERFGRYVAHCSKAVEMQVAA